MPGAEARQVAKSPEGFDQDALLPIANGLAMPHDLSGAGSLLATKWTVDASRALLELRVAGELLNGSMPRTAIAEALVWASAGNCRLQFPHLDQAMDAYRNANASNKAQSITLYGFTFELQPTWGPSAASSSD